jgi:hypothetical protein
MPEGVERLCSNTGLRCLNLMWISRVDRLECLSRLTGLTELHWSSKARRMRLRLHCVWPLRSLQVLEWKCDRLIAVPDDITQLSSLSVLKFSGQSVASLPNSIGMLVRLRSLHMVAPELLVLPEAITALTRLTAIRATGVLPEAQSPAVQAFLAGRWGQPVPF